MVNKYHEPPSRGTSNNQQMASDPFCSAQKQLRLQEAEEEVDLVCQQPRTSIASVQTS